MMPRPPDSGGTIIAGQAPRGELTSVVQQSLRRSANMVRSRVEQFLFTAVTVEDPDGGHSIVSRSNHVMASVANHHCLRRVDTHRLEGVAQKGGPVGTSTIQFGAEHAFKIDAQFEVIDDAFRVNAGLAGCNKQAPAWSANPG